jgi:hypothetical protein
MTAENDFTVKPLTNLHYVAPTNKSDEQSDHNNRRYKRKPADPQIEGSEETTNDNGDDSLHVIDYCA